MMNQMSCFRIYRPETEPEACVFVVHGMQEHKERYIPFAEYLNANHIVCLLYDLPGHGDNTEGELGWFGEKDGWRVLIESAVQAANVLKKEYPDLPLIYFGHSMGTMVGRCFLQNYDQLIDGMILSGAPNYQAAGGAGIAVADAIALFKGKQGYDHLLDTMATGSFNKAIRNPRTALDWLSYNPENVDAYIADPLCGQPFTIQGYRDLFTLMSRMGKKQLYRCLNPQLPIYLFAGEDDPCIGGITGFQDTEKRLKDAGYTDISTQLYPHRRHETMHEENAEAVLKDTVSWIEKHILPSE